MDDHSQHPRTGVLAGTLDATGSFIEFLSSSWRTIMRHKELFAGIGFTLVGLLSFNSDKFCDGNTADYLSCTRPSTFYYFDWLDITLIVAGVFLALIWYLRDRE